MTPFLQFRLWWRRGGAGERLAATLAAAVVVVLVGWALVPTTSDDEPTNLQAVSPSPTAGGDVPAGVDEATAPEGAPDSAGETVVGGDQPAATSGAASPVPGGPTAAGGDTGAVAGQGSASAESGGRRCPPAPSGAVGVTDRTISIAVALLDLAGPIGNGAANQASADDQQRMAQAVIADINARGGAGCRQLTAKFFKMNPIGADQGRSACLEILQSRPAVVADLGGFAFPQSAYACVPQQKVPLLTVSLILSSEAQRFAPYLASVNADAGTIMRDTAFGLRDRGWFTAANGFKKLGLLYDECSPEVNRQLDDALAKAGITGAQISKYTFACPPNGFGSPAEMAQAVAQHRTAGVTHVIPLTGGGTFRPYTDAAEGQGFRPKYAVTDYQGMPITSASSLRPNPENFDRAVAMTPTKLGNNTTPGLALDEPTKRCQALAAKAGLSADIAFRGGTYARRGRHAS
jgi:hypothetical protein